MCGHGLNVVDKSADRRLRHYFSPDFPKLDLNISLDSTTTHILNKLLVYLMHNGE